MHQSSLSSELMLAEIIAAKETVPSTAQKFRARSGPCSSPQLNSD